MTTKKHTQVKVRDTEIKLMSYTRSLELCARMNYETENLDFIDEIREGQVLYDLGACEGRFSVYGAAKNIFVYSFEPDLDNYEVLNENIKLNGFEERIKPFNVAVGDKEGEVLFKIGQPWPGGHQKV